MDKDEAIAWLKTVHERVSSYAWLSMVGGIDETDGPFAVLKHNETGREDVMLMSETFGGPEIFWAVAHFSHSGHLPEPRS